MPRRIAILGGTFDPVHHGHLLLARDALEHLGAEHVLFMPAPSAPLRERSARASFEQRAEMLRLALGGEQTMRISLEEGRRAGPSYTIDTVEILERENPGAELVWIIGADQLERLPRWHRIDELARKIVFACAVREGFSAEPPSSLAHLRVERFSSRNVDISSTEIRERIARGADIRWLLPDAVLSYMAKNALYRN